MDILNLTLGERFDHDIPPEAMSVVLMNGVPLIAFNFNLNAKNIADFQNGAIGLVILTGGGTAMPILQNLTRQLFPLAEIADGNRLSSVGFGLACDARRYFL